MKPHRRLRAPSKGQPPDEHPHRHDRRRARLVQKSLAKRGHSNARTRRQIALGPEREPHPERRGRSLDSPRHESRCLRQAAPPRAKATAPDERPRGRP